MLIIMFDIIEQGYKLPLHSTPLGINLSYNLSAKDHSKCVEREMGKLVEKDCITE